MQRETRPLLVAGAGIAGLCTAIGLLRAGRPVRVLEQAPVLGEAGAGLSLAPNATRALASLGLLPALLRLGQAPRAAEIRHYQSAERMSGYEMGAAMRERWGAPYLQIPRTDLQVVLLDALRALDAQALQLDARVEDVTQDESGVRVQTSAGTFDGAALLAADGVRSVVRSRLFEQPAPHFLGYVAWRAVLPRAEAGPLLDTDTVLFLGPRRSLLRYLMRDGSLVNVAAFARREAWADEGWSVPALPAEIEAAFSDWHDEPRRIAQAIARRGAVQWGLFGRPPLARWCRGRVALVGDAAHPMLPFLGQGAAMAIEDGVVLARALAQHASVPAALEAYERARYERAMTTMARADRQGLRIHGHITEGGSDAEVPRDDFAEYGYDAATVPL